jgi:hypothetical protein
VLQLSDDLMRRWHLSPAIDLSQYAGHSVRVRFRFETLDARFNNFRGWYIDDFQITSTAPPACSDAYEPNNSPSEAKPIAYGQTRDAVTCPNGDYDFYAFTGTTGDKVVVDIDARTMGSTLDSYVSLLDSDGIKILNSNDDEAPNIQDSKLWLSLPHDGTFYIKVRAYNHPSVGGPSYTYRLRLYQDTIRPQATMVSPANNSYLPTGTTRIAVEAADAESGVLGVTFFWHSADWNNSDWVWLGEDMDGTDGWAWNFDASTLPDQQGAAFYAWAFDWTRNLGHTGARYVNIDHTPPVATLEVSPMYGDAPFRDFHVAWEGTDSLSGVTDYNLQFRTDPTIPWTDVYTATSITHQVRVGQDGNTYYFRVRARDQAGNWGSFTDGTASYAVRICPTPPDVFESDNAAASAQNITTDGAPQTHTFHTEGDEDWAKFTATVGITYTIATTNTGGHADTILYLYGADGALLMDPSDDYPGLGFASRLAGNS